MKKFIALLMACVLPLGMATPVFAEAATLPGPVEEATPLIPSALECYDGIVPMSFSVSDGQASDDCAFAIAAAVAAGGACVIAILLAAGVTKATAGAATVAMRWVALFFCAGTLALIMVAIEVCGGDASAVSMLRDDVFGESINEVWGEA